MPLPWRNDKQQLEYEAQLPDRFEDAGDWIAAGERALTLVGLREVPAADYGIVVPLATRGRVPTASVPALWELRDDYEQLRLRARFASVAGRKQARETLWQWYLALRAQKTPPNVQRYQHAVTVLQQYLLNPDRRLTFSKILSSFGLAPGQKLR